MTKELYKILVSKVTKETPDAVSVQFSIPENLKNIFQYKQGQYLSLQIKLNGEIYRRDYSICSSPYYNEPLTIAAKKVDGGKVSTYIYDILKSGDVIESYSPQGNFYTELKDYNHKTYVLIGGGSGITPLMSILKSILVAEPKSKVILYYGNLNKDSIIFKKELDNLADLYKDRFSLYYTLEEHDENWQGLSGRVNTQILTKILIENSLESEKAEYFICGPTPMMQKLNETLLGLGVENSRVHIEYFTAPEKKSIEISFDPQNSKERKVKVILGNDEEEITVPPDKVILDAALNADLDPPYSCRSGICSTCRARLISGKVYMKEREGLSDAEIEQGFILTCQSIPLTDDVRIKYE